MHWGRGSSNLQLKYESPSRESAQVQCQAIQSQAAREVVPDRRARLWRVLFTIALYQWGSPNFAAKLCPLLVTDLLLWLGCQCMCPSHIRQGVWAMAIRHHLEILPYDFQLNCQLTVRKKHRDSDTAPQLTLFSTLKRSFISALQTKAWANYREWGSHNSLNSEHGHKLSYLDSALQSD